MIWKPLLQYCTTAFSIRDIPEYAGKIPRSSALPSIKYNYVLLFLRQMYWLLIYTSKYFLIDQPCKFQSELNEMIQNRNVCYSGSRYRFISSFSFQLSEIVRVRHLVDTDLYTWQHGLTHFTYFHGTHWMFYFCVRCSHTLCPLTRTNIEGHYALYLTS